MDDDALRAVKDEACAVTGIEETSVRALAKLEQVLPARLRRRVQALTAYTVPVLGYSGPTVDADVLTALTSAAPRERSDPRAGTPSVMDTVNRKW